MQKQLFIALQYLLPQHLLSNLVGRLANLKIVWIKNRLIERYINHYHVDLSIAKQQSIDDYASLNDFFIRELAPNARPINRAPDAFVSPVDGAIASMGKLRLKQILQAKNFNYDLDSLLGNDKQFGNSFINGDYATLYLAPKDYHRIHMPIAGKLLKTIYVPGKLFSVNITTANHIPNLYARNERLICFFKTDIGTIAIILVGAIIVGSMQTVWMDAPIKSSTIKATTALDDIHLNKGDELGHFKMGSTVILLLPPNSINWLDQFALNDSVKVGQQLAVINSAS